MYKLYKQVKKVHLSSLFHSKCKYILFLLTMCMYSVYPAMSKSPQLMLNCLKISETSLCCCHFLLFPVYLNQVPEKLYFGLSDHQ